MSSRPQVTIVCPEGVPLRFGAAAASERVVAFVYDLTLLGLLLLVLGFLAWWTLGGGAVVLLVFLLRQGYFVWFEARANGTTPGKRRLRLRVVRADGGPLSTGILIARNLTREVEFFLPLSVLLAPDTLFPNHEGLLRVVAAVWVVGLMFVPLATPERLRIGDLLAGTRVVVVPEAQLLRDLADARGAGPAAQAAPAERFVFREAQLSIYGEHELQVLESLLRKARAVDGEAAVAAVAAKIAARIGWDGGEPGPREQLEFLQAFYAAQRRHLENRLLLGRRRERKAAKTPPAAPPPLPPA